MVIRCPEVPKVFISKIRDMTWVAARIHSIDVLWKERLPRISCDQVVRRRVHTFHLIEHHAFVGKRLRWIVDLVVPALLHQCLFADQRVQDCIYIDFDQIVEILHVLARHWITVFVGEGEGVDKSRQRTLAQFYKWFLDWILL